MKSPLGLRKISLILRILSMIIMKSKDSLCTIRDIYYGDTQLFDVLNQQKSVQDTIKAMCFHLKIPRNYLGVTAGLSKGIICGWGVRINIGESSIIHLDESITNAQVIDNSEIILKNKSKPTILVIIEKEATFMAIREQIICNNLITDEKNIILLTGKGYPCLETLKFITLLEDQINPEIKILVDYDPYGMNIALQYKLISNLIINESWANRQRERNIEYIGLSPSIVDKYTISSFQYNNSSHGLTTKDLSFLRNVKEKCKKILWHDLEKSSISLENSERCLELEILYQDNPINLFIDFIRKEILMTGVKK